MTTQDRIRRVSSYSVCRNNTGGVNFEILLGGVVEALLRGCSGGEIWNVCLRESRGAEPYQKLPVFDIKRLNRGLCVFF